MSLFDIFNVSSSAISAQRLRMNATSVNLANIETTKTPDGGSYKRKRVIFTAEPVSQGFHQLLRGASKDILQTVKARVVDDETQTYKRVYDPGHPDADGSGFVTKPNINVIVEMVEMLSASRTYEANITAFNATKDMALRALEIGG